jgi:UDP-N-acetylmuramoyl-L-alanyl-D-glutamate--2,6-diaminopimelate ligase
MEQAAITGTNGKSSTVHMVKELWKFLNCPHVSMGTLGIFFNDKRINLDGPHLTTYEEKRFLKVLDFMSQESIQHLVFEASSHGLHQNRISKSSLTVAAFTNLTHDHLDYHKTFENYKNAKIKLFNDYLSQGQTAVLNHDDENFDDFLMVCKKKKHQILTTSSRQLDADIQANHIIFDNGQTRFDLTVEGTFVGHVNLPYLGRFQVDNVLIALAIVFKNNLSKIKEILPFIPMMTPIKGRMECFSHQQKMVVVDYAHTPDALEKALLSLKEYNPKKLWVILGCGGNRDPHKRPIMGSIAQHLSDYVIITDDNPRFEDPSSIRQQILQGALKGMDIANRYEAILYAISYMEPQDILLIAGKGHEEGQIVKDKILPFSDQQVVREILNNQSLSRFA